MVALGYELSDCLRFYQLVAIISFSIQSTFTDNIVCFNLTSLVTGVLVGKNLKDDFYFWVLHLHCVNPVFVDGNYLQDVVCYIRWMYWIPTHSVYMRHLLFRPMLASKVEFL